MKRTKIQSRHTCCICGKKRNKSLMEAVNWRYYKFPNRLSSFTTYACKPRYSWSVVNCLAELNRLKVLQSAPISGNVSSGQTNKLQEKSQSRTDNKKGVNK